MTKDTKKQDINPEKKNISEKEEIIEDLNIEHFEDPIVEDPIVEEPDVDEADKKEVTESMKKIKRLSGDLDNWTPRTEIGRLVKEGKIKDIDEIIGKGKALLESEIVDFLIPNIEVDLLLIGQSKGKFGGGQRRVFKQTQKKTREGNKPQFATMAVVGNRDGYVGVGYGKAKETVPAREKAIRNAKLNLIKIRRGCGDWACECGNPHTIPLQIKGKCSSVNIIIKPAPKGKGLCIESECQKILSLAGVTDVWSKTFGMTKTKTNLIMACFEALKNLSKATVTSQNMKNAKIIEGRVTTSEEA
jgi:small subunit ribosomal protein S5